MNTSTFQSNEKYLNSKINGNIEGRQSRKERILLSYSRKKRSFRPFSHDNQAEIMGIRKRDKEPTLSSEIKSHK